MQSTPKLEEADPHDIFIIDPVIVLAAAQTNRPSIPQPHAAYVESAGASPPTVDTTFRASDVNDVRLTGRRPSTGGWFTRAFVGFLFAICSAMAAAAWQHHGDTAKQMIASWAPQFDLSSLPLPSWPLWGSQGSADQSTSPAPQIAAQASTTNQTELPAQSTQSATPETAAQPPEATQLIQSMARDLASMGQQIEQLRASNAQLKATQEQMSRDIAKASAIRNSQARLSEQRPPSPVRPTVAPARRPAPEFSPAQGAATPTSPQGSSAQVLSAPVPPPPSQAPSQVEPVVRPPLPVR